MQTDSQWFCRISYLATRKTIVFKRKMEVARTGATGKKDTHLELVFGRNPEWRMPPDAIEERKAELGMVTQKEGIGVS